MMIDIHFIYLFCVCMAVRANKRGKKGRKMENIHAMAHTGVGGVRDNFPVLDFCLLISAAALHTPDGLARELQASPSVFPHRAVGHWGYILAPLHLASHLGYQACHSKCFYLCHLPTHFVSFLTFILFYVTGCLGCVPCACSATEAKREWTIPWN